MRPFRSRDPARSAPAPISVRELTGSLWRRVEPPPRASATALSAPWFRGDKGEVREDQRRANRGEGDLGPAPAAGEAVRAPLLGFDTAAGPLTGPGPIDCLGACLPLDLKPANNPISH